MEWHLASWRLGLKIDGGPQTIPPCEPRKTSTGRFTGVKKISSISHQIFAKTRTRLWGYRRGCGTARTHLKKKKRKVVHINKQCLRIGSLNHNTAVVVTEFAYKKQKTLKLPFRPNCVQGRCCLSRAAGREGARDASGSMISGRNQEGTRQRSAVIGCVWLTRQTRARRDARSPSGVSSTS